MQWGILRNELGLCLSHSHCKQTFMNCTTVRTPKFSAFWFDTYFNTHPIFNSPRSQGFFPLLHMRVPPACFPLLIYSYFVIMSQPNTQPNNKDKHPGVIDLSPQRCTPAHKRVDDEKAAEEKQAREDVYKAGIR
jgi:hypothetical protein